MCRMFDLLQFSFILVHPCLFCITLLKGMLIIYSLFEEFTSFLHASTKYIYIHPSKYLRGIHQESGFFHAFE